MLNKAIPEGKILNIGHRGAPGVAPENTIASFKKALEIGGDGVELDVSLSKDGAIMVFHDYFLNKKTDGKGLLARKTRYELQALDAAVSGYAEEYRGEKIPTLGEVVEALDEKAFFMIEIKTNFFGKPGIEEAVASLIKRYNLFNRVVVSSFNPKSLKRIKDCDKDVPIGLLHFPVLPWKGYLDYFQKKLSPEVIHPYHKSVNENYISYAREKGCRVITWTLKEEKDMRDVIAAGVDAVITDYPDIFSKIYNEGS